MLIFLALPLISVCIIISFFLFPKRKKFILVSLVAILFAAGGVLSQVGIFINTYEFEIPRGTDPNIVESHVREEFGSEGFKRAVTDIGLQEIRYEEFKDMVRYGTHQHADDVFVVDIDTGHGLRKRTKFAHDVSRLMADRVERSIAAEQ
mgnify:CR=1 FL=1